MEDIREEYTNYSIMEALVLAPKEEHKSIIKAITSEITKMPIEQVKREFSIVLGIKEREL